MQPQPNTEVVDMSESDDEDMTQQANTDVVAMSESDDEDMTQQANTDDVSTRMRTTPAENRWRRLSSMTHTTKYKLLQSRLVLIELAMAGSVDDPIDDAFGSDCTKDCRACLKEMVREVRGTLRWQNVPRLWCGDPNESFLPPPPRVFDAKGSILKLSRQVATLKLRFVA